MAENDVWHAQQQDAVLRHLETAEQGLSDTEARARLQRYGANRLTPARGRSFLSRFFEQFRNALIYVLLGAAVVTALLGHWVDTSVILGVVIINALIGVIQEGKAEKALNAIKELLSPEAVVRRNGETRTIEAESLVPGDLVMLQSGDRVPADLRLLRTHELRVDEALLTGESEPVAKTTEPVPETAPLAERFCMAYSGSLVNSGTATGVVVASGESTEIGRISGMLGSVETLTTPLLRQVNQFARWLALATLGVTLVTFLFGWLVRSYQLTEMFLVAVGLAVAAIPEGLPAILTITLAIGVQRMARRNAIIRQLPAVETLGAVTTVCSDKTGTLTRNEMTVTDLVTLDGNYRVTGVGYEPEGDVVGEDQPVTADDSPLLQHLARAALLCNDASLRHSNGQWEISGDPTEAALISFAYKCRLDGPTEAKNNPRVDAIPFESEHRFMATLHHDHEGRRTVFVKGAPERILEMCSQQLRGGAPEALEARVWEDAGRDLANDGKRVLALASLDMPQDKTQLNFDDVTRGLVMVGLVGMVDPPRPEAIEAVASAQSAGIQVKMITGDHAATAAAIGRSMNIGVGKEPVTGAQLESLSEAELADLTLHHDVFARTSPEHKLRLVKSLQSRHQVVAMTGDGVNDAPALKRADVGVAMGRKGTEAAKQAAQMVLADDNFASIVHAVEEGRIVYDNLKKAILFILPTNGGEALSILAAIALGMMMPISPVQILWINMVTAVTLALTLAFEPAEDNVMGRPPRPSREPLLTGFLIWRTVFVSLLMVLVTFGLFFWYRSSGFDLEFSRTVAVNALVFAEVVYLLNTRVLVVPALSWLTLKANPYVWYAIAVLLGLQLLFTYTGPFQALFATEALGLEEWGWIVAAGLMLFVIVELEKWVLRRFRLGPSRRGGTGLESEKEAAQDAARYSGSA